MAESAWRFAPYLHVDNASAAIDWYVRVFGAVEKERYQMDNGEIGHAELDLHGHVVYLADLSTGLPRPEHYNQAAITLYAIVPDVDEVFNRAIDAGATVDRAVEDQSYGYRSGGFVDPFGHVWRVATPLAAAT